MLELSYNKWKFTFVILLLLFFFSPTSCSPERLEHTVSTALPLDLTKGCHRHLKVVFFPPLSFSCSPLTLLWLSFLYLPNKIPILQLCDFRCVAWSIHLLSFCCAVNHRRKKKKTQKLRWISDRRHSQSILFVFHVQGVMIKGLKLHGERRSFYAP